MARRDATGARSPGESHEDDLVRLYLDNLGEYPLLTREDEARLARLIQEGREAKECLDGGGVTGDERRELARAVREGEAATEQFINCNLRLVVSIAKKYQSSDLSLLDLVQEGNLGLMHAVTKFDWRKGFKFSTYATWWIKQAIGRGIDNTARTIRLPSHAGDQVRRLQRTKRQLEGQMGRSPTFAELAQALDTTEEQVIEVLQQGADPISLESRIGPDGDGELGDVVPDASSPSAFEVIAEAMVAGELDKLLALLDEREQKVLRLRYGLGTDGPRTLEKVGVALHMTRERTRQIERTALCKLRHPSAKSDSMNLLAS
jgi:RNA polymerase sigma factor (sigma-70 family)